MKQVYYDANIEAAIKELEERIPELFQGPSCPNDIKCDCTYKTGCKALTTPKVAGTVPK